MMAATVWSWMGPLVVDPWSPSRSVAGDSRRRKRPLSSSPPYRRRRRPSSGRPPPCWRSASPLRSHKSATGIAWITPWSVVAGKRPRHDNDARGGSISTMAPRVSGCHCERAAGVTMTLERDRFRQSEGRGQIFRRAHAIDANCVQGCNRNRPLCRRYRPVLDRDAVEEMPFRQPACAARSALCGAGPFRDVEAVLAGKIDVAEFPAEVLREVVRVFAAPRDAARVLWRALPASRASAREHSTFVSEQLLLCSRPIFSDP